MYINVLQEHNAHFLQNRGLQAGRADLEDLFLRALGQTVAESREEEEEKKNFTGAWTIN